MQVEQGTTDPADPLVLTRRCEGGRVVVSASGEVEIASAPVLRAHFSSLSQEDASGCVVLDLSHVPFIDSSGLGAIINVHKTLRTAGGQGLTLVVSDQSVRRMLEITGIDRVLAVHDTLDQALV
ncbi:MAG: anti-sigma factor antagonist [Nocardioides sp.]|nr:anti-sigma factor antagonist [Nocardioides sp.]